MLAHYYVTLFMTSDLNEALYGKEVAHILEAVDAALEKVNKKYKAYFSTIKSKTNENEQSSLKEFTHIQWNQHGASISFLPELRKDIAQEAEEAFLNALK